jgi:hypothetical protein
LEYLSTGIAPLELSAKNEELILVPLHGNGRMLEGAEKQAQKRKQI